MLTEDFRIKKEHAADRSIHFLIPALSAAKSARIPLPSGKYILAPSPSELFHYYESVQPQMNSIISSSEGLIDHLTSENFIHIVENLSEYSIPCPVLQSHVDKSTSMVSMDDFDELPSQQPSSEHYFRLSPSYYDPACDFSSATIDDPNLFLHNEQLNSYMNHSSNSSSNCEMDYQWTTLPVAISSSTNHTSWRQVRLDGKLSTKSKGRNSRKRTKFSNDDLEILNLFFDKNPMPSRSDISILSEKLAYPRYIVQVWFYNKRQSLKRVSSCPFNRISK